MRSTDRTRAGLPPRLGEALRGWAASVSPAEPDFSRLPGGSAHGRVLPSRAAAARSAPFRLARLVPFAAAACLALAGGLALGFIAARAGGAAAALALGPGWREESAAAAALLATGGSVDGPEGESIFAVTAHGEGSFPAVLAVYVEDLWDGVDAASP